MLPPLTTDSPEQLVLACHITGVYDVNRRNTLPPDDFSLVCEWADSLARLGMKGILFHNNFTEETRKLHENEYLMFVSVTHDARFTPNVFRYFVYRDFLRAYTTPLTALFVTDVNDVVALQNPFMHPLFGQNPTALFCGDEPKPLANEWMFAHATHLRQQIADYAAYEATFAGQTLLNCGIIGGHRTVMQGFIEKLCHVHEQYNTDNPTAYTGDMGAFNYLARTGFNAQLVHGSPVNTVFKAYQTTRTDCWFRHK
jgi:hypothetical protein